jgi:hypothetical protein
MQSTVCVTGLVSGVQRQWAEFFRRQGRRVVGYYDGFRVHRDPGRNPANAFQGILTDMITPSSDTAAYFRANGFGRIPVAALGQPTLETVAQAVQQTNPAVLARQLGIPSGRPTLLFIGQYGTMYAQAFQTFCQAAQRFPNANLLVSLHPNVAVDGRLEHAMIQQYGLQNRVRILPKTIPTAQALALADVVLSHNSTLTVPAFVQGKPVVFVGPDDPDILAPLEIRGFAPRCVTPLALAQALDQAVQTMRVQSSGGAQHMLGIPTQASARIADYILAAAGALGFGGRNAA